MKVVIDCGLEDGNDIDATIDVLDTKLECSADNLTDFHSTDSYDMCEIEDLHFVQMPALRSHAWYVCIRVY